jgi:hypothetical protein
MGRKWYVVALCLLLTGAAGAGWILRSGLSGSDNSLIRTIVPGSTVLTLNEPGSYTIFYEMESVIDGRVFSPQDITGLRVGITSEDSGVKIPLKRTLTKARYSFPGHQGISILSFDIAQPGRYRLDTAYPDNRSEPQAVLAVGDGFVGQLLGTMFGAFGLGLLGCGGALALVSRSSVGGARERSNRPSVMAAAL